MRAQRYGRGSVARSLSDISLAFLEVLMTVSTRVIHLILQRHDLVNTDLRDGLRIQILPTALSLANCQRHQNAPFIQDHALLVLWADGPQEVIAQAQNIEGKMREIFARGLYPYGEESQPVVISESTEGFKQSEGAVAREDGGQTLEASLKSVYTRCNYADSDCFGTGYRLAADSGGDSSCPCLPALDIFRCGAVTDVACLGRLSFGAFNVYLYSVIDPTIKSLKVAISTYEMQGGKGISSLMMMVCS